MPENLASSLNPLKYEVEVQAEGRVEFTVPFLPGAKVLVFVIEETEETEEIEEIEQSFDDYLLAAQSSLDFWDNPYDDDDWNDVSAT